VYSDPVFVYEISVTVFRWPQSCSRYLRGKKLWLEGLKIRENEKGGESDEAEYVATCTSCSLPFQSIKRA